MEINLTKENLKNVLEAYYQKEGRAVNVSIEAKKSLVGYGLCETMACVTTITLKEEITLMGVKNISETTLSREELTRIISDILESEGYTLEGLSYNEGLETKGYLRDEYQEAYFKGVRLKVSKNKSLVRKL